ncbi:MAG: N-formylglutamate amidohydrolase [Roseobacter sp.]
MTGTSSEEPALKTDDDHGTPFLTENDPAPVEWINADSQVPILLLCEHAGQAIPKSLQGLGLPDGTIDLHIGWDIGAEKLARSIAAELGAPLILQRYSRLVIDCNRPTGAPSSIPQISDDTPVPGNQHLHPEDQRRREEMIFAPLDAAITTGFAQTPRKAAFSIHSFTRHMKRGAARPCDAGFLCRKDLSTAESLMAHVSQSAPDLDLAINQPYQIESDGDWFIPHHAETRGLRHSLIEVCNDQLGTRAGIALWSRLLAQAIRALPGL